MDELERLPDEDELAERGRLLIASAVARAEAPHGLRERLATQAAAPAWTRRRLRPFAWAAGALAVVALLAVVVPGGGGPSERAPTVLAVAKATVAGPAAAAPRPVAGGFVDARMGAVRFPDWTELRWPATGRRTDRVGDRAVQTVFYAAPDGATAAYAVVEGPALEPPDTGRERRAWGTTYRILEADGDRIVTWERAGHTCVLRAPAGVPEERLLGLAAWEPA
jgi:hypothetical protein